MGRSAHDRTTGQHPASWSSSSAYQRGCSSGATHQALVPQSVVGVAASVVGSFPSAAMSSLAEARRAGDGSPANRCGCRNFEPVPRQFQPTPADVAPKLNQLRQVMSFNKKKLLQPHQPGRRRPRPPALYTGFSSIRPPQLSSRRRPFKNQPGGRWSACQPPPKLNQSVLKAGEDGSPVPNGAGNAQMVALASFRSVGARRRKSVPVPRRSQRGNAESSDRRYLSFWCRRRTAGGRRHQGQPDSSSPTRLGSPSGARRHRHAARTSSFKVERLSHQPAAEHQATRGRYRCRDVTGRPDHNRRQVIFRNHSMEVRSTRRCGRGRRPRPAGQPVVGEGREIGAAPHLNFSGEGGRSLGSQRFRTASRRGPTECCQPTTTANHDGGAGPQARRTEFARPGVRPRVGGVRGGGACAGCQDSQRGGCWSRSAGRVQVVKLSPAPSTRPSRPVLSPSTPVGDARFPQTRAPFWGETTILDGPSLAAVQRVAADSPRDRTARDRPAANSHAAVRSRRAAGRLATRPQPAAFFGAEGPGSRSVHRTGRMPLTGTRVLRTPGVQRFERSQPPSARRRCGGAPAEPWRGLRTSTPCTLRAADRLAAEQSVASRGTARSEQRVPTSPPPGAASPPQTVPSAPSVQKSPRPRSWAASSAHTARR